MLRFCILVFGCMSAFRALAQLRGSWLLNTEELPKIGTAVLSFPTLFAIAAFFFESQVATFAFVLAIVPCFFVETIMLRIRLAQFQRCRVPFLTLTILKMKSGASLRSAVDVTVAQFRRDYPHLNPIFQRLRQELVVGGPQSLDSRRSALSEMLSVLLDADRSSHRAIAVLTHQRTFWSKCSDFRRRSGQVLVQIRAQALLLTALYIATFVYVSLQFGARNYLNLRLFSLALFIIGVLLVFIMGRKVRWKV